MPGPLKNLLLAIRSLFLPWTWKMAWRDSRAGRSRLLLYSSAIVLGIAALVAIGSFAENLEAAVEEQSKTLLGADLVISARRAFTDEQDAFLRSIGGQQAREISLPSMAYFPKTEGSRLVQVRAIQGGFPFYGKFQTRPSEAARDFRSTGGALVEEILLAQFDSTAGDSIRIGELTANIQGVLEKIPGEALIFSSMAPRVYLSMDALEKTNLLLPGNLARHRVYFKFPPDYDLAALLEQIRPQLQQFRFNHETVEHRKENVARSLEDLSQYLRLTGFIALLLGGIGIAGAIHVHIKQKLGVVALLRCLGAPARGAFAVYLAQAIALGCIGALAGGLAGLLLQQFLPFILADFLPLEFTVQTSLPALLHGMGLGFVVCVLFAFLPLLAVRGVSPLAVFRSSETLQAAARKDPLVWLTYGLIAGGLVAFSIAQMRIWYHGLAFAVAVGLAFALLGATAWAIAAIVKRTVRPFWPYVWRQGLANLYRPNNRTVLMMFSLGLGTFLILTLYLTQSALLHRLLPEQSGGRPNTVLFDIQEDQREPVEDLLRAHQLPVLFNTPIVTMRLTSVRGQSIDAILGDPETNPSRWSLFREYRSTYRSTLSDSEELIAGEWVGQVDDPFSSIPISIEERIARELEAGLGDELVFDVLGFPVTTHVASIRRVDWRRFQPNFFVVFPSGVLESAPALHVLLTRSDSAAQSASFQRELVQTWPNVSVVDMTLVLDTLDTVLSKISFGIRFMALFTVGAGLLILASAVLTGKYQRVQESVLLRTLGASKQQLRAILLVEHFLLGILAALTGILLALAGSWALTTFVFNVPFTLSPLPILAALLIVASVTVLTGLFTNRGIRTHSPLEILRSES